MVHSVAKYVMSAMSVLALGACSSQTPNDTATLDPQAAFMQAAKQELADAESGTMSDAQAAILRRIIANGEVSFDDAAEAAHNAVACMEAAGLTAGYTVDDLGAGIEFPTYQAGGSEEVADACDQQESSAVSYLYQTQPSTTEAFDRDFELKRPALVACLKDHGVAVDSDATTNELYRASNELAIATENSADGFVDCLTEAGFL